MKSWRSMSRPRLVSWGAVALVAAALPATAVGVTQAANAHAVEQQETASPILATPQSADDKLPAFLSSGDQALPDFDPASSRFLGADDTGIRYWLGEGVDHQTCLVGLLPGSGEFAAMSCATTDQLYAAGLTLQLNDDQVSGRGVYAPIGFDLQPLKLHQLTDQFAVGDATQPLPTTALDGRTADGDSAKLELQALPAQPAGTRG